MNDDSTSKEGNSLTWYETTVLSKTLLYFLIYLLSIFYFFQFIHQNGGFTKVWVSLKTIFFPIIVAIMVWFWRRISQLSRPPALLEYMLMVLGAALTLLNCKSVCNLS